MGEAPSAELPPHALHLTYSHGCWINIPPAPPLCKALGYEAYHYLVLVGLVTFNPGLLQGMRWREKGLGAQAFAFPEDLQTNEVPAV